MRKMRKSGCLGIHSEGGVVGAEISPDAKKLIDYLGSSSDALLLEDLNKMTNMDMLRIYTLMIRRS